MPSEWAGAAASDLGTELPRLSYPKLGEEAPSGGSELLSGRGSVILFPCRVTATGRRHPHLSTPEHSLSTDQAQVKKKGAIAWPGERRNELHQDWGALCLSNRQN